MPVNSRIKATKIHLEIETEKSYNLLEKQVDLPPEKGSRTSCISSEEHLPK